MSTALSHVWTTWSHTEWTESHLLLVQVEGVALQTSLTNPNSSLLIWALSGQSPVGLSQPTGPRESAPLEKFFLEQNFEKREKHEAYFSPMFFTQ